MYIGDSIDVKQFSDLSKSRCWFSSPANRATVDARVVPPSSETHHSIRSIRRRHMLPLKEMYWLPQRLRGAARKLHTSVDVSQTFAPLHMARETPAIASERASASTRVALSVPDSGCCLHCSICWVQSPRHDQSHDQRAQQLHGAKMLTCAHRHRTCGYRPHQIARIRLSSVGTRGLGRQRHLCSGGICRPYACALEALGRCAAGRCLECGAQLQLFIRQV